MARRWARERIVLNPAHSAEAVCPVIVSASRATDIPAFFSDGLMSKLEQGFLKWQNPFNAKQSQFVSFSKTRLIVFWSKNPEPLIQHLPALDARNLNHYVQYTLNDYEQETLEPGLPTLEHRVDVFKKLADTLGPKRVIWRFDPLILSERLTCDELLTRIDSIATKLNGYTEQLVISFADIQNYRSVKANLKQCEGHYREFTTAEMQTVAGALQAANTRWALNISTCAEPLDLNAFDISHGRCIDDRLMIDLFPDDQPLMAFLGHTPEKSTPATRPDLKDKGQRKACGCIMSKDIGRYHTCKYRCGYCYANRTKTAKQTRTHS